MRPSASARASPRRASSARSRSTAHWTRSRSSPISRGDGDRPRCGRVATSAIRDAGQPDDFLARARKRTGLRDPSSARGGGALRLPGRRELPTLADGVVLDLGGGSMQIVRVADRDARDLSLVADGCGADDRALPAGRRRGQGSSEELRDARGGRARARGVAGRGRQRLVGRRRHRPQPRGGGAAGRGCRVRRPGLHLRREALGGLVERLAAWRPSERATSRASSRARGPDPRRRVVIDGGRGRRLRRSRPPRPACVRASSSRAPRRRPAAHRRRAPAQRCATSPGSTTSTPAHTEHVATLALGLFDGLAAAGLTRAPDRARAAVGPHAARHRRGRRLRRPPQALALPDPQRRPAGLQPREVAIIAQAVRYHRKGRPDPGALSGSRTRATRDPQSVRGRCCGWPKTWSGAGTRSSRRRGQGRRRHRRAGAGVRRRRPRGPLGRVARRRPVPQGVRPRPKGKLRGLTLNAALGCDARRRARRGAIRDLSAS